MRAMIGATTVAAMAFLAACGDGAGPEASVGLGGAGAAVSVEQVAVDSQGAAIVGGVYEGALALGGAAPVPAVKQLDGFIAKVDASGAVLWQRAFGGVQPIDVNRDDRVSGIAIMPDDSVVVTGYAEGVIDLGGGPLGGDGDDSPDPGMMFVARYGADGTHLWSQRWRSGRSDSTARALAVGPDGAIYLAAAFTTSATIGATELEFGTETVVVKLDAGGAVQWARPMRPTATQDDGQYDAQGLVATADGVFVTGTAVGAVDFGLGPLADAEDFRTYVARLDAVDGALRAVGAYQNPPTQTAVGGIAALPGGGFVLGGSNLLRLGADLAPLGRTDLATFAGTSTSAGSIAVHPSGALTWIGDHALVELGADGTIGDSVQFPAEVRLGAVAVGPAGDTVVAGGFSTQFTLADQTFALATGDRSPDGFVAWLP